MGTRVPDPTREIVRKPAVVAAAVGFLVGVIIAGSVTFLLLWRDPLQPGTGPCAEAAERWAQVDETAKWEYLHQEKAVYIPSDGLVAARGEARVSLEACRAAGS